MRLILLIVFWTSVGFPIEPCEVLLANLVHLQGKYIAHLNDALQRDTSPITPERTFQIADDFVSRNPTLINDHTDLTIMSLKDSGHPVTPIQVSLLGLPHARGIQFGSEGDLPLINYRRGIRRGNEPGHLIYVPAMALRTGFGATLYRGNQLTLFADADSMVLRRPSPTLFHEKLHVDSQHFYETGRPFRFYGVLKSTNGAPISGWSPQYSRQQSLDEGLAYAESVYHSVNELNLELAKGTQAKSDRIQYWKDKIRHYAISGAQVSRQTFEIAQAALKEESEKGLSIHPSLLNIESTLIPSVRLGVDVKVGSNVSLAMALPQKEAVELFKEAKTGSNPNAPLKLQTMLLDHIEQIAIVSADLHNAYRAVVLASQGDSDLSLAAEALAQLANKHR